MSKVSRKQINYQMQNYLKEHLSLYIFTIVLFIMGVIFGSIIIHSLSPSQKQELFSYINQFFIDVSNNQLDTSQVVFTQVLFDYLKYLALIWFLGLSIIGMPLIFILIFMKGFVIGFTVSFLILELQWRGFLFSLASVVPQNLIVVPVLILAGVAGTLFSLSLIKGRLKKGIVAPYQQSFISYSLFILILGGLLVVASAFEVFISPFLMKAVSALLIKS